MGRADCQAGASHQALSLASVPHPCNRAAPWGSVATHPRPGVRPAAGLGCGCCFSLFSSLVIKLLPSYSVKEGGTGTQDRRWEANPSFRPGQ